MPREHKTLDLVPSTANNSDNSNTIASLQFSLKKKKQQYDACLASYDALDNEDRLSMLYPNSESAQNNTSWDHPIESAFDPLANQTTDNLLKVKYIFSASNQQIFSDYFLFA